MNQRERIVDYMERFGSISPLDAFKDLGITKLATRVGELRREGVAITQCWERSRNRFGEMTAYMRYRLAGEDGE